MPTRLANWRGATGHSGRLRYTTSPEGLRLTGTRGPDAIGWLARPLLGGMLLRQWPEVGRCHTLHQGASDIG